jgi:hypothetical protein
MAPQSRATDLQPDGGRRQASGRLMGAGERLRLRADDRGFCDAYAGSGGRGAAGQALEANVSRPLMMY